MIDQIDLDGINNYLANNYGKMDGFLPNYRLVWGPSQLEKRKGTFRDYDPVTKVFLREVTEVREIAKYRDYPDCYILEKMIPNPYEYEIVGSKYSYEPIWTYTKKDLAGERMDPSLLAIQYFMKMSVEGPKKAADWAVLQEALQMAREISHYEQELEHEAPLTAYGGVGIL